MENASTPARFKVSFRGHELEVSPLNTEQDVMKRMKLTHPTVPFQKLWLEDIEADLNTRTEFGDDGRVVDAPVVLKQNLSLNTTPLDPKNRTAPMFVYMDCTKAELVGTNLQSLITASEGADAATVAEYAKTLYETISNELSELIAVWMKKHDIPNHYKVTAFRGAATMSGDRVKVAVCMLGEYLPKLIDLEKILGKPDVPGYMKKLKWMPGGSQGMTNVSIKKSPGKVRATRCRIIRCRVIRCRALTHDTLLSTSRFYRRLSRRTAS